MTRVLIAPDKFKGSLTGSEVAESVRRGILRCRPDAEVHILPVADGGEGTLDAARAASSVPSPPSATGRMCTSASGRHRRIPRRTDSATSDPVSDPLNLSGAISTRVMAAHPSTRPVMGSWIDTGGGHGGVG